MKLIGLSGGIATGKSTVSNTVSQEGVPVVDCDKIARAVVKKVLSQPVELDIRSSDQAPSHKTKK